MVKVIKGRVKIEGNHETLNVSCYFLFIVSISMEEEEGKLAKRNKINKNKAH